MDTQHQPSSIVIRGVESTDWEDIATILLSPRCQWGTLQIPYTSRDQLRKKTEQIATEGHGLVAIYQDTVVGIGSLETQQGRRSHVTALGMAIRDDYQGQGIGSQLLASLINLAENWLNLQRLELFVYCDNESAISLYKKYNFVIEGTLKKFAFRQGKYVNAYLMARVKFD